MRGLQNCKLWWFAIVAVSITGCVTSASYREPSGPDVATITGTRDTRELADAEDYFPLVIDGRYTYRKGALFGGTNATAIPITPGEHKIVVETLFWRGAAQFSAYVPLAVQLSPSHKYKVRGVIKDTTVEVWIDDETSGARKIAAGAANFSRSEAAGGKIVPLFLPN